MIEQNPFNDSVEIFIGDEDILMGYTGTRNVARVWFAPLPEGWDKGFCTPVTVSASENQPPENVAAVLYFLNRPALESFIDTLKRTLDASFPKEEEKPQ